MTNPFQTHNEKQWEDFRRMQAAAFHNGLVKVKLSARRYIVVTFGGAVAGSPPRSWFTGSIAFGPATYQACEAFIHEELAKIPVVPVDTVYCKGCERFFKADFMKDGLCLCCQPTQEKDHEQIPGPENRTHHEPGSDSLP